jgi:metal-responsive CopG/Arc/MetJ family transcriptional regulator
MLYRMVMSRREVLVQLEDDLVASLDAVAAARGMNRSELIRTITSAFLNALDEAEADAELVAAYTARPQDPAEIAALTQMALETWPDY